jgi:hypothetical protein
MMRGFWQAMLGSGLIALFAWVVFLVLDLRPSAALCGRLAEIGSALLIAYAIVTAGIVAAAKHGPWALREARVGRYVGLGGAGLVGIVLALLLSEHDPSGPWQWFDQLAFAAVCTSFFAFGLVVVFQPRVVHEWEAAHESAGRSEST